MITVSQISIYPLKSAAPIDLQQSVASKRGLENDRHWMLIDSDGIALTARECPSLLKVESQLIDNGIMFTTADGKNIELAVPDKTNPKTTVDIWSTNCPATLVSAQADQWFSDYLQTQCRLVYMRDEDTRDVEPKVGGLEGDVISFADENPLLLIGEASLAELNARLDVPVTMKNFRPNIVVKGTSAFEEDTWKRISIGKLQFRIARACKRCVLTTIDPNSTEVRADGEPLKTLARFRYDPDRSGVLFGVHLIPLDESSQVSVGSQLTVVS